MSRLAPLIAWALEEAGGIPFSELEAVAVGVGPGSYTGVRIGVATAKGIAAAARLPLYGVPSTDAVAQRATALDRPVMVVADAARGEVYPMLYRSDGGALTREGEFAVLKAEEAAAALGGGVVGGGGGDAQASPLLTGDGLAKHLDLFRRAAPAAPVAPEDHWYPSAQALIERAPFAADRQSGDPDLVLPIYTRLSDAEEAVSSRPAGEEGGA